MPKDKKKPEELSQAGLYQELERLRGLIRDVVKYDIPMRPPSDTTWCLWCKGNLGNGHVPGCPWAALVAEADR